MKFGTAIIGDDFHVFRATLILSEVRLGWVRARVGYPITPTTTDDSKQLSCCPAPGWERGAS